MKSLFIILALIASLPLFGLGVASMFEPTSMYELLNLKPQGIFGINTVRSDIGGMLISSAIMIWLGLWARNPTWLQAAIVVMSTLLTGRAISTVVDGFTTGAIPAIVVEVYAIVVLYFAIKSFGTTTK